MFQRQIVEGVYSGMGNVVPEDVGAAFNGLPKGAVEFFRVVAQDALEGGNFVEKYPFLAQPLTVDEDTDNEAAFQPEDETADNLEARNTTLKKRAHSDTPSTPGEGSLKKKAKRNSFWDQRAK